LDIRASWTSLLRHLLPGPRRHRLLFAQSLVALERQRVGLDSRRRQDKARRIHRPHIGRTQHDGRLHRAVHRAEPVTQRACLLFAHLGQGRIHVTGRNVDQRHAGFLRLLARDIPRALAMADDP
jgi:hypothetical protein